MPPAGAPPVAPPPGAPPGAPPAARHAARHGCGPDAASRRCRRRRHAAAAGCRRRCRPAARRRPTSRPPPRSWKRRWRSSSRTRTPTRPSRWRSRTCCCPAAASAGCAGSRRWQTCRSMTRRWAATAAARRAAADARQRRRPRSVKVWEEVGDEYVYWEDFLVDPVRAAADMRLDRLPASVHQAGSWTREFAGLAGIRRAEGRQASVGDLLNGPTRAPPRSRSAAARAMKTRAASSATTSRRRWSGKSGTATKRRIIWFIREASGIVLRVDPDSLQLAGLLPDPGADAGGHHHRQPHPAPLLRSLRQAGRRPRRDVSARISALTKQIKVRGAYNAASRDIADILTAGDGKMIPVDGVDLINGGLQNHIWMMPIDDLMTALDKLFMAREQIKQVDLRDHGHLGHHARCHQGLARPPRRSASRARWACRRLEDAEAGRPAISSAICCA